MPATFATWSTWSATSPTVTVGGRPGASRARSTARASSGWSGSPNRPHRRRLGGQAAHVAHAGVDEPGDERDHDDAAVADQPASTSSGTLRGCVGSARAPRSGRRSPAPGEPEGVGSIMSSLTWVRSTSIAAAVQLPRPPPRPKGGEPPVEGWVGGRVGPGERVVVGQGQVAGRRGRRTSGAARGAIGPLAAFEPIIDAMWPVLRFRSTSSAATASSRSVGVGVRRSRAKASICSRGRGPRLVARLRP